MRAARGERERYNLLVFRARFPILSETTYLVSHSLGAMPAATADRMAEYARDWATRGVRMWEEGWWEMPATVGAEIAPLIGADRGEVVMVPNMTLAQATILSSLDYTPPRDTIVMTALDFPSVRYVYDALATRLGAKVRVVESRDGITIDEDELCAAIDERTRLVAVSEVLFRSAYWLDVPRVVAHAHRMGALVALDSYHSVGVVPVDVKATGVDWLAGGVLKWLCGGPGGAFIYAAPHLAEHIRPSLTGWQAHSRPFGFEHDMDHTTGGWRWLSGTPAIPALYAAIEGPRILREAGIDAIRAASRRRTARLIELADARGWRVHAPRNPDRRAGTVTIDVPDGQAVCRALAERKILTDYRPGAGLRIAPHFYNTDDEIETVVAAMDDVLAAAATR